MPATRRDNLPAAVYALVDRTPGTVLLEGAGAGRRASTEAPQEEPKEEPWTGLFMAPLRICAAYQADEVPGLFAEIERAVAAGHCAAGFFSYECGIAFEPKAGMRPPRAEMPLAWFGIYERAYLFDHQRGEFLGGTPPGLDNRDQGSAIRDQGSEIRDQGAVSVDDAPAAEGPVHAEFALAESDYARHIAAIHDLIRAGDVYQLNFTAPFRVQAPGSAAALYARLRARQPSAYGAFVHWQQGRRALSFSPELFFRVDCDGATRRITTRPMKGTARRGRTSQEDRQAAEWLRNDAKNRSENLMIVDLVRNDLGRVARFGTVKAEKLFAVERLPSLWQMTSTVTAELRDDAGFEEIFKALFPCGSITGAPKVRAMQLIGELEDGPRGVYTGAIGYFSPGQSVFNVAIRTLELDGEAGAMGVGSGVVIDSDAAAEYRECLLKAEFLTQSAQPAPSHFSLIETMLWENGYPLVELHLDRLADSAAYFDFPCDRAAVKAALEAYAGGFARGEAHRVRLLLNCVGDIQITDGPLASAPGDRPLAAAILSGNPAGDRIGRVSIAQERTDSADRFLFHKTTHRPLYSAAFQAAAEHGFDDVLFFNTRGELTEGAISTVFIEKDGRWFTPPVDCGVLPGVYRRYLLELRPEIEERVMSRDDLRDADGIYLANAVRGLRKVLLADPMAE